MVDKKKILPIMATFTGLIAMIPQINALIKVESFEKYSPVATILSIISATLWLVSDWSGSSWVVLSGLFAGLLVQVYILYGILSNRGMKVPSFFHKKSNADLSGYTI